MNETVDVKEQLVKGCVHGGSLPSVRADADVAPVCVQSHDDRVTHLKSNEFFCCERADWSVQWKGSHQSN